MFDSDKKHIERITKAVAVLYDRIDHCRNSDKGFVFNCAELNTHYDTDAAMDMIMADGSETYDFIQEELVEEVVELVQALYFARENFYSFPPKSYNGNSDDVKEYNAALDKAIKRLPLDAETMRVKQNSERLHKIVTDFSEWVDDITANPLGKRKNHTAEYMLEDAMAQKDHEYKLTD